MIQPHDLGAFAKHAFYESKRKGEDTTMPLAFMGAATIAIGAKMLFEAWKQTKVGRHAGHGRGR